MKGILVFLLFILVPLTYEGMVLQREKKILESNLKEGIHFKLPGSIGYRFTIVCKQVNTMSRIAYHKGTLTGCNISNDLHNTVLLENLDFDFEHNFFSKKVVLYKDALKVPLAKIDASLDIKDVKLELSKEGGKLTRDFNYRGIHVDSLEFFSNMVNQVPLLHFFGLTHEFTYKTRDDQRIAANSHVKFTLEAPFKQVIANALIDTHPLLSEAISALPPKAKVEGRNQILARETGQKVSFLPDFLEMVGSIYIDLDGKYTITKEVALNIDLIKGHAVFGSNIHFEHFMKLIDKMYSNATVNSTTQKALQPANVVKELSKWNMVQYDDLNAHLELTLDERGRLTINGIGANNLLLPGLNFNDIMMGLH